MTQTALIIVDFQNDFLPGGALGVPDGGYAAPLLWKLMDEVDVIVFTRDWHPADHCSFSKYPEYRDGSWPAHCVQGTEGAEFDSPTFDYAMDTGKPTLLVNKGDNKDKEAYSGFQGKVVDVIGSPLQRAVLIDKSLAQALYDCDVRKILVGGLALDYCVKATALDARSHCGDTTVYLNATRPVAYLTGAQAVEELVRAGVRLDAREF